MMKRTGTKDDQSMIFLIPELCSITGIDVDSSSRAIIRMMGHFCFCVMVGITDVMRRDFSLMKEMSVYTHVGPTERYQQLNGFLQDIQRRDEGRKELEKWQITLDQDLVQLKGRTMESETIQYKDVRLTEIHLNRSFVFVDLYLAYNSV